MVCKYKEDKEHKCLCDCKCSDCVQWRKTIKASIIRHHYIIKSIANKNKK